jgi:hypothetical protein
MVYVVDWEECRRKERETCALVIDRLRDDMQTILLHCGEMTAEEQRAVQSALRLAAFKVRGRTAISDMVAESLRLGMDD